ncbi:hypothetical protein DSL72_008888 [Monilinia vaccinii-corymbosi]|uniref:Uncharacterized protein n=1 Tax=Monilinia vaccinii-corymbosi TaxID=61207 RepID=A0A8A3PSE2_9HELO|nr:hypothetical protein DSL72_008888 [Monilinia vaccinii-corymbosi]
MVDFKRGKYSSNTDVKHRWDCFNASPEVYSYPMAHEMAIMERQLNLDEPYTSKLAFITAKQDKQFKKSLALKDGFPNYPFSLHSTLFRILSVCILVFSKDDLDAAVFIASLLLEWGFDVHRLDEW